MQSGSTTLTFKPLDDVSEIHVAEDGTLSWDVVDGATAYEIRIDGKVQDETVADTAFGSLTAGTHSICVRPVVDGDTSYYSKWSKAVSMTVLKTVEKDKIRYEDGYIRWSGVSGASTYVVMVNGAELARESGTSCAYDANGVDFSVAIRALGNHVNTFDGALSEEKNFLYLDPVTGLTVTDGVLTWNPVENATGYKLRLGSGTPITVSGGKTAYDKLVAGRSYTVAVMPISDDDTYFATWSANQSVEILAAPKLNWNADLELDGEPNQNLWWDRVAGGAGYVVKIQLPDGSVIQETLAEAATSFGYSYENVGAYSVSVKTVATGDGIYDSLFSKPIVVRRLAAPQLASSGAITSTAHNVNDGFTVTFRLVEYAKSYALYQDLNKIQESSAGQTSFRVTGLLQSGTTEEQHFNYKIRSVGSVTTENGTTVVNLSSLSSEALSFEITVLAMPTNLDIAGTVLSYGAVDKAVGYSVAISGVPKNADGTSYDLNKDLTAGTYEITVCARGNGENVLASAPTGAITVHRLAPPKNIRISTADADEGQLKYDSVEYAQGYYLYFNSDETAISADTISNLSSMITTNGTYMHMVAHADYFNDLRTIYYMSSLPSTTTRYVKLAAPAFPEIAFTNTQLLWNAPGNVNTALYTPTYEVYKSDNTLYNGNKNGTTMDISYLAGGKDYAFRVKAIGNGVAAGNGNNTAFINSDYSEVVSIYKLATPEVSRADGRYVWDAVARATNYVVLVDGEERQHDAHSGASSYSFTPNFTAQKTYSVEIRAVGDNGITTISSDEFRIDQATAQLQTPSISLTYSTPDGYTNAGQLIATVTTVSPYARGYRFSVAGRTEDVTDGLTYAYTPNASGTFMARAYALGGNFDEQGVYYVDSQASTEQRLTLLGTIGSDSIKIQDRQLRWGAVSGAPKYQVTLTVNGTVLEPIEVIDANSIKLDKATIGYDYSEINSIKVEVRAVGNGTTLITGAAQTKSWDTISHS